MLHQKFGSRHWHQAYGLAAAMLLSVNSTGFSQTVQEQRAAQLAAKMNKQAVQTIYREGVPHTDRQGRLLHAYDPERSFFPLALWGAPPPVAWSHTYDWAGYKRAGFNTFWVWPTTWKSLDLLNEGATHQVQIVLMNNQTDEALQQVAGHPNLLGIQARDEPSTYPDEEGFQTYLTFRKRVAEFAPGTMMFIGDIPYLPSYGMGDRYVQWNQSSDVSSHNNYPIRYDTVTIDEVRGGAVLFPTSILFPALLNGERKPNWVTLQTFSSTNDPIPGEPFQWVFPTSEQTRAMAYAAIVHGATGLTFFTPDSFLNRSGAMIGFAADPQAKGYEASGTLAQAEASPERMARAVELWHTVEQINQELTSLVPSIFAPTVGERELSYRVLARKAHSDTPIRTLLKPAPVANTYHLFVVNLDEATVASRITIRGKTIESVKWLHGDGHRQFDKSNQKGAIDYKFEPYEAGVMEITIAE